MSDLDFLCFELLFTTLLTGYIKVWRKMDALFRTKNVNQERFQCSPNSEKPVVFRSSSMVWYTPVTNESGTTPPWWSPSPPPFAGLIVYLGMMVGAFLWGALADRIGRRQSLLISLSINSVFSFFSSFVQGYSTFLFCRLLSGVGSVETKSNPHGGW